MVSSGLFITFYSKMDAHHTISDTSDESVKIKVFVYHITWKQETISDRLCSTEYEFVDFC